MNVEEGINIIILIAGKGSRMKSEYPKIFQKIANLELFKHVIVAVNNIKKEKKNIIIVSNQSIIDNFSDKLPKQDNLNYTIQKEQLGTGDATKTAVNSKFWNSENKYTGIFYGDVPFIKNETIDKVFNLLKARFDLVVLGFDCHDQTRAYGRLFTDRDLSVGLYGVLYQIKEFKDLTREKPRLCNSGIIIGKTVVFEKLLPLINDNNNQKEYYLTDIIGLANDNNYRVGTYICDEYEAIGINSRSELAHAEKKFQNQLCEKHMENGATLLSKESIYFSYDTQIGQDVIIEPNVFFGVGVKIGNNCKIKAGSYLENVKIEDNTIIEPNTILIKKNIK